jgi:hypothetical protein
MCQSMGKGMSRMKCPTMIQPRAPPLLSLKPTLRTRCPPGFLDCSNYRGCGGDGCFSTDNVDGNNFCANGESCNDAGYDWPAMLTA